MMRWCQIIPSYRGLMIKLLIVTAVVLPWAQIVQAGPFVRVYTEVITLQSYDWRSALQPTMPDDPIYPYPRLDFDRIGPLRPITSTVVVLESAGTRLTIAPEYGGRILRWFDKRNQRNVLYVNPVIKPTGWGYRGWWLATGGIEWAFPTNEHGLNEWRPWRYQTYSGQRYAAVTVSDHDDRTGLDISVTIVLNANDQLSITPRIVNRTRASQIFQFWINAMLPYSPEAQFDLPAKKVEVHSTGDDRLPGPGQLMDWPVFNGRDFSIASNWEHYLGVFAAPATRGRVSIYDPVAGLRITRSFPVGLARGVKVFLLGDLPADLYTDGDSRYFELWGDTHAHLTKTPCSSRALRFNGLSIGQRANWKRRVCSVLALCFRIATGLFGRLVVVAWALSTWPMIYACYGAGSSARSGSFWRMGVDQALYQRQRSVAGTTVGELARHSTPVIVVAWHNPAAIMRCPSAAAFLTAYGNTRAQVKAIVEALAGSVVPLGRLPMNIQNLQ